MFLTLVDKGNTRVWYMLIGFVNMPTKIINFELDIIQNSCSLHAVKSHLEIMLAEQLTPIVYISNCSNNLSLSIP